MLEQPDSVPLREYFEVRLSDVVIRFEAMLAANDKAVQIAMVASEKAVVKAEIAAEKRFEAVNEFRGQLSDQAATFMPRAEAEQRLARIGEDIVALQKVTATGGGRAGGVTASWAMMLGLGGLILTIIGVVTAVVVAAT